MIQQNKLDFQEKSRVKPKDNFKINTYTMRLNRNKCSICSCLSPNIASSRASCCDKLLCQNCVIEHQCSILILNTSETNCARCTSEKAIFKCSQCDLGILCQACDCKVHQRGKFLQHQRVKYKETCLEAYQQNNPYNLSINNSIPKINMGASQNDLVVVNIKQTWNQVQRELQAKFQEVIDVILDKKKQIINKIEKRRDKQLISYEETLIQLAEFQLKGSGEGSLRKSQVMEKYEAIQKKIQSFELDYSHGQDRKSKFSVANCQFQSLKTSIERIQIKGLLLKIVNQPDKICKNKMRSSVILTNNSGSQSTIYRTPKNGKSKMSVSTIEAEMKDGLEKPNEEEQKQKVTLKSTKLQKVKSEKLFSKASGSLKSYFYDRIKKKGQ